MLGLRWSGKARRNLASILTYIADDNSAAAAALLKRINSLIEIARHHPHGFRPGRVTGTRELVAHPNYIVVYRVTDTTIEIVTILHARQQYP